MNRGNTGVMKAGTGINSVELGILLSGFVIKV